MEKIKRTKLTDEEFNIVTKWTGATHFDSVMDIETNDDGDDIWMDYENEDELSLEEGFHEMAEAVAYPFAHEGLTDEESKILLGLLEEFGVDEPTMIYIRNLNK